MISKSGVSSRATRVRDIGTGGLYTELNMTAIILSYSMKNIASRADVQKFRKTINC